MKILHLCISCFYVDGYSYQENELVSRNLADGHEVRVIASTEQIHSDGSLRYGPPGRYVGGEGAEVERLPYGTAFPHAIAKKLRIYPNLYERIAAFAPDVILFHGACSRDIATVARYVREHPHCRLYVDSHEDAVNSARSFISKWVLHYLVYRPALLSALPQVDMVLPVSIGCLEFMRDFYGVPGEKLEFYPVGGEVVGDDDYRRLRAARRSELGVAPDEVLIVQSGKFDRLKKLPESLRAFTQQADPGMIFAIAGQFHPDVKDEAMAIIERDPRIRYLGWQQVDELRALLCAADVYCQPGAQSATMQMSLCCRCAIILADNQSHRPYLNDNGWLVKDQASLTNAFAELSRNRSKLPGMAEKSHELALRMLDYRILAARLYR